MKSVLRSLPLAVVALTALSCITMAQPQGILDNDYQNEHPAKVWYFGENAGIDFRSGVATPLTDGALQSFEGCAAIADETGNLLFYTNGGSLPYQGNVWNANHQVMPNGNLAGAGGCNSSFQSSLILQHPKLSNLYYLFTTDCIENSSAGGLRYNIIDMNLAGGLGDVAVKGQYLGVPMNESLTAIRHENKRDWWIIAHRISTDSFYVYEFTPWGITGVLKQKIGPVTPIYAGTLKASTNGQKLCYSGLNWTALFDFDPGTGLITNYVNLQRPSYSNEFSPNCRLLYLATGVQKQLYQIDVLEDDPAGTAVLVGTTSSVGFGNLQRGPDGKIYCARFISSPYLGVINKPDYQGTQCNYVDNGFYLQGKMSKAGLPNFANVQIGECHQFPSEYLYNVNWQFYGQRITDNSASLGWTTLVDAKGYKLLQRQVGEAEWAAFYTEKSAIDLSGLQPETEYEYVLQPVYAPANGTYEIKHHYTAVDMGYGAVEAPDTDSNPEGNRLVIKTLNDVQFSVYPNPAREKAQVSFNLSQQPQTASVSIMDAKGHVIEQIEMEQATGYRQLDLALDQLSNGVYHITLKSGALYEVQKLVVMK